MVSLIWEIITSTSSMKITLPLPESRAPGVFFLQYFFCVTALTSVSSSISGNIRVKAQSLPPERSSKPFFVEA